MRAIVKYPILGMLQSILLKGVDIIDRGGGGGIMIALSTGYYINQYLCQLPHTGEDAVYDI